MKKLCVEGQKFQEQQEFSFLLEMISQKSIQGCLQVLSHRQTWLLYFERGRLIYAYQANNMWEIFSDSLFQLCPEIGSLDSELVSQLQEAFATNVNDIKTEADYLTICWLVEEQYLSFSQAGNLIQKMAVRMLESILKLDTGTYQFLPQSLPEYLPKFCHLDVALLTRRSQLSSLHAGNLNLFNPLYNSYKIQGLADLKAQSLLKSTQPIPPVKDVKTSPQILEQKITSYQQVQENNTIPRVYKILCIDDSPVMLKTITTLLDKQIFSVIGVDDPLKALMQILRIKPDLILLDISMPQLNGYKLCFMLRKHANFATTPVVMLTARTGLIDKARAKMVKASAYLSKPFTKAELLKVVFSQLGSMP